MNIFKKLFGKKEEAEQEKKQECWYNNAHEGSAGYAEALPCDVNGGLSQMEYTVAKNIAQK
jgi:hypothetical protein